MTMAFLIPVSVAVTFLAVVLTMVYGFRELRNCHQSITIILFKIAVPIAMIASVLFFQHLGG